MRSISAMSSASFSRPLATFAARTASSAASPRRGRRPRCCQARRLEGSRHAKLLWRVRMLLLYPWRNLWMHARAPSHDTSTAPITSPSTIPTPGRVDETLCRVRRDPNAHKTRQARGGKSRIRLPDFDVASDSPAKPRTVTPHRKAGTSKRWLFLACAARHEPHFPGKGNDAFQSLSDSAAPPGAAPVKITRNNLSVAPENQRS